MKRHYTISINASAADQSRAVVENLDAPFVLTDLSILHQFDPDRYDGIVYCNFDWAGIPQLNARKLLRLTDVDMGCMMDTPWGYVDIPPHVPHFVLQTQTVKDSFPLLTPFTPIEYQILDMQVLECGVLEV